MSGLATGKYDRESAVNYARHWAFARNPDYYNFDGIGGDCTNFASQCLHAGKCVMNFTPTLGWFYISLNNRAPAWSSVKYLYKFLTGNNGAGPFGREVSIEEAEPGDLVQLAISGKDFQHTPVITSVSLSDILVTAHTFDCRDRPLSTYDYKKARFIHIEGFRLGVRE